MVDKEFILKSIDEALTKCGYPKSNPSITGGVNLEEIQKLDFSKPFSQVDYQNQATMNHTFEMEDNELKSLRDYFGNGYLYVSGKIYDTPFWSQLKDESPQLYAEYDALVPKMVKEIDSAIDKAPRLQENKTFHRFGDFPSGLKVGDTGEWKAPTSTSFSETDAKRFDEEGRYNITIKALKGQKGICGDGFTYEYWGGGSRPVMVQIAKYKGEGEYLLPSHTRWKVEAVDDTNRTATIVIY